MKFVRSSLVPIYRMGNGHKGGPAGRAVATGASWFELAVGFRFICSVISGCGEALTCSECVALYSDSVQVETP